MMCITPHITTHYGVITIRTEKKSMRDTIFFIKNIRTYGILCVRVFFKILYSHYVYHFDVVV